MKITLASYLGVMLIHGGPTVQIMETYHHLRNEGIEVELYDQWASLNTILNSDLFHLFAANMDTFGLARHLYQRNKPFVVSPIFYTRRSSKTVRRICQLDQITRKIHRGLWWDYGFRRDICEWAEKVLPNTSEEAQLIHEGLGIPREKITVVPNGVSKMFAEADPVLFKKEYGLENFILNVGHIGPDRKNMLALVKALAKIDHRAVIIGRITRSPETEQVLAEVRKNKNILLIEGLDHDSPLLASAYAACDVFALPSKFETPGIAALEAALAGAKIVITPYGGTRDYFQDMAIYVDPYSVESIRAGIIQALDTPPNSRLRQHILDNYTWDKIALKTLSVYREVLSG
ncbi:MAG: glycosyltransferase [Methanobacteriota archaeon]|nr:MAG: glycosyltransferase [Euryarchaeota archaeon]